MNIRKLLILIWMGPCLTRSLFLIVVGGTCQPDMDSIWIDRCSTTCLVVIIGVSGLSVTMLLGRPIPMMPFVGKSGLAAGLLPYS